MGITTTYRGIPFQWDLKSREHLFTDVFRRYNPASHDMNWNWQCSYYWVRNVDRPHIFTTITGGRRGRWRSWGAHDIFTWELPNIATVLFLFPTEQLHRSNWGLIVLLKGTCFWKRGGNPVAHFPARRVPAELESGRVAVFRSDVVHTLFNHEFDLDISRQSVFDPFDLLIFFFFTVFI